METLILFSLLFLYFVFRIIKSYTPGGVVGLPLATNCNEIHWFRQQNRFIFYLKPLVLLREWSLWGIHLLYEKRPELPEGSHKYWKIHTNNYIYWASMIKNNYLYITSIILSNTAEVSTNEWLWMFLEKDLKSTAGNPPPHLRNYCLLLNQLVPCTNFIANNYENDLTFYMKTMESSLFCMSGLCSHC